MCVCAHASPDGDALGSLLGLGLSLAATGRDVVLYQDGDEPFPRELAFLQLDGIQRRVPADAAQRTLIALDCGSALRIDRRGEVAGQFARVVNIDHHHDNTLFGTINLVDPEASCTAEIVAGLLDEAGIPLAEGAPLALYVGLVTDTGRFQYVNTTPRAHRLAARLLEEGVQPALRCSRRSSSRFRSRASGCSAWRSAGPQVAAGGRLAVTSLARDDFDATGADDAASDGVVDALRAIEGVELAALIREPRDRSGPARKVSLRSRAGGARLLGDRARAGRRRAPRRGRVLDGRDGGGDRGVPGAGGRHVNAAVLLVDKPAGPTSFGCVARVRGALGGRRVKVGHAGTLDPFATGLLALLVGRATRLAPYLVGLDKRYRTVVQFGVRSDTGDPEGVLEPGDGPLPDAAALAAACAGFVGTISQVPPATSAIKVGGQRAYALARAGQEVEMVAREVHHPRARRRLLRRRDAAAPCSTSTVPRAPTSARWRAISARRSAAAPTARSCGGWRSGISTSRTRRRSTTSRPIRSAGPWRMRCSDALAHLPARELEPAERDALLHGRAIAARGEEGPLRCLADGRLVCVAGPRGDELRSLVVVDEE